jgi:hypothetical protein
MLAVQISRAQAGRGSVECPKTSASLGQQFPGSLKITTLYFAILLHCTRNASCVEQMTIILSDMEKGYNAEHFVGFISIDKTTAAMSVDITSREQQYLVLSIQSYHDNGADISGVHSSEKHSTVTCMCLTLDRVWICEWIY